MTTEAEGPPRDRLKELHEQVDAVGWAMNGAFDKLPSEPRSREAPHPVVAELAREILQKSRDLDALVDGLEREWSLTTAEQKQELAVLRVAHQAAGDDVRRASDEFQGVLDHVSEVLDNMYLAQQHVIPRTAVLSNRAIRPLVEILEARLSAQSQAHHWPPSTPGRDQSTHPIPLAPLPADDADGLHPRF